MNKRIKKKRSQKITENVVYDYLKDNLRHSKYVCIYTGSKIYHIKYGFIYVTKDAVNKTISLLKKEGYLFNFNKYISKDSKNIVWIFNFL